LITCEDVAKILTAFNPSNPDNDFFFNIIIENCKNEYDHYSDLITSSFKRKNENEKDSILHLFARDQFYYDSDEKKFEMDSLITNIFKIVNYNYINSVDGNSDDGNSDDGNSDDGDWDELIINFANEISLENKTPIQIAIENLNIDFLSIFMSVVGRKCLEEYNALLQERTLAIDPNYDQNLLEIFQQKAAEAIEAIEEIEKFKSEITPTNPKGETLMEFEIGNQIYGLMLLALLTNNNETQIAIINNIIDIIEQQQLTISENNISKEDIFKKICLGYFDDRNGLDPLSYEEAEESIEIDYLKEILKKEDHHERLIKIVEEALESRLAYLSQNQKYQEAAIYFCKEIPEIQSKNLDHFSREFDDMLTKKDSKQSEINPEFLPFSTVIHDIFDNFKDLEKGKEVFKKSLKEYAAGKDQAFVVSMIMLGGVIDKVANQIKESRKSTQDQLNGSLLQSVKAQQLLVLGKRKRAESCPPL
jgi:hypothetical protein